MCTIFNYYILAHYEYLYINRLKIFFYLFFSRMRETIPLKTYLLRPYPGEQLDNDKMCIYNYRHCRARLVEENTFGILTQKFRIFNRRIQWKPENTDVIVLAFCVLHNLIKICDDKQSYNRNERLHPVIYEVTVLDTIPFQGVNASQQ